MKSTVRDVQGRVFAPGMKNSFRQKGQSKRSCLWGREKASCSQTCALSIWYARRMLLLVASHSLRTSSKGTNSPCGLGSGSSWQKGVALEAWGSDRNNDDWQERCSLAPFSSVSILRLPNESDPNTARASISQRIFLAISGWAGLSLGCICTECSMENTKTTFARLRGTFFCTRREDAWEINPAFVKSRSQSPVRALCVLHRPHIPIPTCRRNATQPSQTDRPGLLQSSDSLISWYNRFLLCPVQSFKTCIKFLFILQLF